MHQKFIKNNSDDEDSSDSDMQSNIEELEEKKDSKKAIPKLDLTKAKKIQEIYAKRSTQQGQDQNAPNLDNKTKERLKKLLIMN